MAQATDVGQQELTPLGSVAKVVEIQSGVISGL